MNNISKKVEPFEVWEVHVAARSEGQPVFERVKRLVKLAHCCGLLAKVEGPVLPLPEPRTRAIPATVQPAYPRPGKGRWAISQSLRRGEK